MRWPWVSRVAYDDMRDERDRLLALVERLTDQIVRIERRAHGMSELPAEPRKPRPKLPPQLVQAISAYESPHIRRMLEDRAMAMLAQDIPASEILAALRSMEEEG